MSSSRHHKEAWSPLKAQSGHPNHSPHLKKYLLWNGKIKSSILMVKNNTEEDNVGIKVTNCSKTITLNGKGTVPLLIMTIDLFCLRVLMGTGTRYLELFHWRRLHYPPSTQNARMSLGIQRCTEKFAAAPPYIASCNEAKMCLLYKPCYKIISPKK